MWLMSLKSFILFSCLCLGISVNQTLFADPYAKSGNIKPSIVELSEEEEANILKGVKVPEGFKLTLFAPWQSANYPVYVAASPAGDLYVSSDGCGSLGRIKTVAVSCAFVIPTMMAGQMRSPNSFPPSILPVAYSGMKIASMYSTRLTYPFTTTATVMESQKKTVDWSITSPSILRSAQLTTPPTGSTSGWMDGLCFHRRLWFYGSHRQRWT